MHLNLDNSTTLVSLQGENKTLVCMMCDVFNSGVIRARLRSGYVLGISLFLSCLTLRL